MGRAKGVVDIDVRHGGQLLGKGGVVFLLLRAEADVFQQHHLAGLQRGGHGVGLGPHDVLGQGDGEVEKLLQPGGHGL